MKLTNGNHSARRTARTAAAVLIGGALALAGSGAGALAGARAATSTAATTAPPYSCAPNGPAGNQTIYGTFGDASVIGWTGNTQAVTACLGGSFFVDTSPAGAGPGSGSTAAVTGTTYGYGVYNDTPTASIQPVTCCSSSPRSLATSPPPAPG
jgi:hypothetical protein